jgi:hypothetical protein
MIVTSRTPRFRADNYLHALTIETDVSAEVEVAAAQFLQKMELIASIHENVLLNVEQTQKQQRKTYATRKGKHLFEGLVVGVTMVKTKKLRKRRALSGRVHISSSGMLMGRETLTLKRAVDYALSKMLMDISGKGFVEISKSITFHQTKWG